MLGVEGVGGVRWSASEARREVDVFRVNGDVTGAECEMSVPVLIVLVIGTGNDKLVLGPNCLVIPPTPEVEFEFEREWDDFPTLRTRCRTVDPALRMSSLSSAYKLVEILNLKSEVRREHTLNSITLLPLRNRFSSPDLMIKHSIRIRRRSGSGRCLC